SNVRSKRIINLAWTGCQRSEHGRTPRAARILFKLQHDKHLHGSCHGHSRTKTPWRMKSMTEFVTYRGIQMAAGWPEEIRAAQLQTTLVIDGRTFQRIPYGRE